jgi:Fe-S oxidoreductase
MIMPAVFNWIVKNEFISGILKKSIGFAPKRSIPTLYKYTLRHWLKHNAENVDNQAKKVMLFADEFTNYNDVEIGIKTIKLLNKLGYKVEIPKHVESGRTFFSKGLLRKAKIRANKNIELLKDIISENQPLIGIEPSAILSFRDEYPEIVDKKLVDDAIRISKSAFMIDEFIASEFKLGNIKSDMFTNKALKIKLHGHCQQKAIASTNSTLEMLSIPENYSVTEIPSGCCGMAGSFGYEKEHYELSQKVGELVLFPEVRNAANEVEIAAPGTSCRHQIKDGTNRIAKHTVEIIYEALK